MFGRTSWKLCNHENMGILLTLSWQLSRPATSFPPPQALFPCGWPIPGRPSAQGVCPLPAAQRTPTEPALALLAAEPGHVWQKQSPQHFSSHHPLPVLHGELESWTDPVQVYDGWWLRVITGSQLTPHASHRGNISWILFFTVVFNPSYYVYVTALFVMIIIQRMLYMLYVSK